MRRRRDLPTPTEDREASAEAENDRIAQMLRRFFAYHAALPPDECVADFLYLIRPGRLLNLGRQWVRDCATPESAGSQVIAEIVGWMEASQIRREDHIALATYALAKTGGVARPAARAAGERLVALTVAHVRALQLAVAVIQRDDIARLARLSASLIAAWPAPDRAGREHGGAPPRLPSRPGDRLFPAPAITTGNAALDGLFRTLDADDVSLEESLSLLTALLSPNAPPTRARLFRRRGLPPLVRLEALGYDEQSRVGFAAELSVERWAGRNGDTRLIRHPDTLFVVTDDAFDQAIALAARLTEATLSPSRQGSGQLLRWSLRRDLPATNTINAVFFASGGSIAGAFAVAFRLVQKRSAWFRPIWNWGVVSGLAEDGALLGVDASTLKAKIEAAGSRRVILSVDQASESTYLLRYRRQILTAASLDEAIRQCLRSVLFLLLRQYRAGILMALCTIALATITSVHITRLLQADKRTEFDASEQFSPTMNPAPYSPWEYGWIPAGAVPDMRKFIRFRRHETSDGQSTTGPGPGPGRYDWFPPDADAPGLSFRRLDNDLAWPAAAVVWPGRALDFAPDLMGDYACLRFVAPREGAYRAAVTYWGASTEDYGTTIYLLADNHLVATRASTAHSTIRRRNAVSFDTDRGERQTIVYTANLRQGQSIDAVVGLPVDDGTHKPGHATGLLFHVSRVN